MATTNEPLDDEISEEEIQQLIAERESQGASCQVENKDGGRVLVCDWPDL